MTERAKKIQEGKRERFLLQLQDGAALSMNSGKTINMTPDQAKTGLNWILELLEEREEKRGVANGNGCKAGLPAERGASTV